MCWVVLGKKEGVAWALGRRSSAGWAEASEDIRLWAVEKCNEMSVIFKKYEGTKPKAVSCDIVNKHVFSTYFLREAGLFVGVGV